MKSECKVTDSAQDVIKGLGRDSIKCDWHSDSKEYDCSSLLAPPS